MNPFQRISLSLVALCLVSTRCIAQTPQQHADSSVGQVGIRVHNDARVPDAQARAAEEVAARVLRQAGVEVEWSDCTVIKGQAYEDSSNCTVPRRSREMAVYFVDRLEAHYAWVDQKALGYSIIPNTQEFADMAFVSYAQIKRLSDRTSARTEDLLGLAIAHEIGHMLSGTHDHAYWGIMRSPWRERDLKSKAWKEFEFTTEQGKRLRAGVEARRKSDELRAQAQK